MSTDMLVFLVVVGLRLGVPLLILRWPLPAILACLIIDAADQTIFQILTDLNLDSYQSYDKALDIYYLTVAYIAVMRNWRHPVAVTVAFGLWYYRLVGVALFELTQWRPLLLIFPNTFEYFFIAIAAVWIGWNTSRLRARQILLTAGTIWIVIKLPQEYWLHVAQRDVTDTLKQDILGVDPSSSWGDAFANRPLVTALLALALLAVAAAAVAIWRRLPLRDHPVTFDADKLGVNLPDAATGPGHWRDGLVEKIVLLGLIGIIFSRVLPNSDASVPRTLIAVALFVAANAVIHVAVTRRRGDWASVGAAFAANVVINAGLVVLASIALPSDDEGSSLLATGFFLFLLSLLVALFDRYRDRRHPLTLADPPASAPEPAPAAPTPAAS